MDKTLRALFVEDSEDDAMILQHALKKAGYEVFSERVDTSDSLVNALSAQNWDIIFSDFTMPCFNGLEALRIVREYNDDIPFIFVSGTIGEERAVSAIKQGANDYLIKGSFNRLEPAIETALEDARIKRENRVIKQALEETRERFYHAFHYSGLAMALVDLNGHLIECNESFRSVLGYEETELFQLKFENVIDAEYVETYQKAKTKILKNIDQNTQIELQLHHKDGHNLWIILNLSVISGRKNTTYFILQFQDITERCLFEQQLLYLKMYHMTTGLKNRNTISKNINDYIEMNKNEEFVIFFIDIDRFKQINESYSPDVGDTILRKIAERLKMHLSVIDIGYFGGNEFVLITKYVSLKKSNKFARKIRSTLLAPISVKLNQIVLTSSIGISFYPKNGKNAESLLRSAVLAMRHCKNNGGDNHYYYDATMEKSINKLKIENDLRLSIEQNEIFIAFQPKMDLQNNRLSGFEALTRWKKDGALILPGEFIVTAEETGLIVELGKIVLKQSIKLYVDLLKNNLISPEIKLAINVSTRQFHDPEFLDIIKSIILENNLLPSSFEIEITETALMKNREICLSSIHLIRDFGLQIAIDDFGTGYSSLQYLKDLPLNRLKIDKSFIQCCTTDKNCGSIVTSIISLAHRLGLKVTAEGVENDEQKTFLAQNNCDELQGYLFSKPLLEDEVRAYLLSNQYG